MKPSQPLWAQIPRNPRYAVLIVFTLILLFVTFAAWQKPEAVGYWQTKFSSNRPGSRKWRDPLYGNLQATLEYEEAVYQKHLGDRKKLIEKWGPKLEDVKAFPTSDFYTMWDFVIPTFSCPFPVTRIGTLGDGGKWVCGFERVVNKPNCVVYSFGVERESSFEAEILGATDNCRIYGYDFSVKEWGPQLKWNPSFQDRIEFHPYKLGGSDHPETTPPMHTLSGLMEMNGHTFVDILKVDIEGSEYDVLEALLDSYAGQPLPFGQLQIEIHYWNIDFIRFMSWWEKLEAAGLRPFWTEPNLPSVNILKGNPGVSEWSFINTRGKHILISDE